MKRSKAIGILVRHFKKLSAEALENLRWHAEQGTRICCGQRTHLFTSADGGG